jgi:hypothetical protein
MKHIHTFESFLNEANMIKKEGDGEIAVMKVHKAKVEKVMSDMGLSYEDLGPKDSSLMNYYKIPATNWDILNKIGAKVDLQSMTILESLFNEGKSHPLFKKGDEVTITLSYADDSAKKYNGKKGIVSMDPMEYSNGTYSYMVKVGRNEVEFRETELK